MNIAALVAAVIVSVTPLTGQTRPATAPNPVTTSDGQEVVHEGELVTFVTPSGESTGWRLRTRTPDGQRRYIEVLLTAEVAQGVRSNTRVQVRGTMKTRHYAERGDVPVLVAKSVIEVARTR